jgi:hypothetical protein
MMVARRGRRGWPRLRAPFAKLLLESTAAMPDACFQVRDTVKSRLDCGVILVRRHFVSTGGVWKRIQSGCPIGLFFGFFGTRQAGAASGADWLPTADARTRQRNASW